MNFFTQGFLFSRTEFRINNNKTSFKVTVFFFTRKSTLVINSFISENSVSAKREKKSCSRGKVHRSFNQILMKFLFLYKSCVCFFPHFCVFCFFFLFHGKVQRSFIHSFFAAEKKHEKNSFFIHSFDIPHKCAKNNFSGEIKNTVPLPVYQKIQHQPPSTLHNLPRRQRPFCDW